LNQHGTTMADRKGRDAAAIGTTTHLRL